MRDVIKFPITSRKVVASHAYTELNLENVYETCLTLKTMLQDARLNRGIKYSTIALKCGLHDGTVRKLAIGLTKEPRLSTVLRILQYFGYKVVARPRN